MPGHPPALPPSLPHPLPPPASPPAWALCEIQSRLELPRPTPIQGAVGLYLPQGTRLLKFAGSSAMLKPVWFR